jgi:hypothetical protein
MSPALLRKGMTKILQNCAFVSYASTFLHLQPRLTQFFAFFLQTRRLSRTSFSLQHILLTINFKKACKNYVFKAWVIALMGFIILHRLKYLHFKFHKNPLENNWVIRLESLSWDTLYKFSSREMWWLSSTAIFKLALLPTDWTMLVIRSFLIDLIK